MIYFRLIPFFIILCLYFQVPAQVLILSGTDDGAQYLREDPMDLFYNKVTPLEISIQLQDETLDLTDRPAAVSRYKSSYNDEVIDPPSDQIDRLQKLFAVIFQKINAVNKSLLPDTIRLITVKGEHYGESTFFTRGHAIVSSASSIESMPPDKFEEVMYHELSHIVSRYHASLRDQLYAHLGYQRLDAPVSFLTSFYNQLLYNPDGVAMDHAIELTIGEAKPQLFIPVIFTSADKFNNENPAFFSYLNFKLLPIDKVGEFYFVRSLKKSSEIDVNDIMKAYFQRITINTQYIIHPDEILADNFMYLFRTEEENEKLNQELVNNIRNTLISFE